MEWPLADLLHAIRLKLRAKAEAHYNESVLVWATLAPHVKEKTSPPPLPEILRD